VLPARYLVRRPNPAARHLRGGGHPDSIRYPAGEDVSRDSRKRVARIRQTRTGPPSSYGATRYRAPARCPCGTVELRWPTTSVLAPLWR